ncbi:hypothetical protein ACE6H2_018327 [Prunus campanulata]
MENVCEAFLIFCQVETSGIAEFGLEEILEFAVPETRLSYLNRLTSTNSIYSRKSRYHITRDLRLCSEKLYALYKIHEKISATGDDKTSNTAYKHLVNGLPDIMKVADVVVEHKNDIFNLQMFLSLPLNPAAKTSGIAEFGLEEILEFAVPETRLNYLNRLTSTNSIYSRKSRYHITRDLRLCSEKLYALYKIHEKISATGDDKTSNTAYKHLVNGLPDIMKVADVVVEHKNDIFNLQMFLSLPLNPAASRKILPIFVQIVN